MPHENLPRTWLQMARRDIASVVIHWTKTRPATDRFIPMAPPGRDASMILDDIVKNSCLLGNVGFIKGNQKCVCFTETPLAEMVSIFASAALIGKATTLRYEPFGVGVPKEWLFQKGGRPVIYQPGDDYDRLPDDFRWRHCKYEPPSVDFTWEREWRIQADKLCLELAHTWIFLPTAEMAADFAERHPLWRFVPLELFGLPNLGDPANRNEA